MTQEEIQKKLKELDDELLDEDLKKLKDYIYPAQLLQLQQTRLLKSILGELESIT